MTDSELKQRAWEVFDAFRLGMREHNITFGPPEYCIDGSHLTAEVGGHNLIIRLKYAEDARGWFGPKRVWLQCGYLIDLEMFKQSPIREMRAALIAIAQDSGVKLPLSQFLPNADERGLTR